MSSVCVLGGLGFVGGSLVARLLSDPSSRVVLVDDGSSPSPARFPPDHPRLSIVHGNSFNEQLLIRTLKEHKVSVVFDCVSLSSSSFSSSPEEISRSSVVGFTHVLEGVRKADGGAALVLVSHRQSPSSDPSESESTPLSPSSLASAAAMACEAMLHSYVISYRMPLFVARLTDGLIGPGADNEVTAAIQGTAGSRSSYNVLHVDDAVDGLIAISKSTKAAEIYNIGGDADATVEELRKCAQKIEKGKCCEVPTISSEFSIVKAKEELSWKPKISICQAIRDAFSSPPPSLPSPSTTTKFLIFGGESWIGQQFVALLHQQGVRYVCSEVSDGDSVMEESLFTECPSHVISFLSSSAPRGSPLLLRQNIAKNVYAPWHLAAICERNRIHFTHLGDVYEYQQGGPDGDSNMAGRSIANRLLAHFRQTLLARIGFPVTYEDSEWNVASKLYAGKIPEEVFVSVLPECLPVLLDLILQRKTGTFELVNTPALKLGKVLEGIPRRAVNESIRCTVDDRRIVSGLRPAQEGIQEAVRQINNNNKMH